MTSAEVTRTSIPCMIFRAAPQGSRGKGLREGSSYGDDLIKAKDIGNRFVGDQSLPADQQTILYVLRPKAP
jgi:hypothetical protein